MLIEILYVAVWLGLLITGVDQYIQSEDV